jgi:hypothetical protein
MNIPCTKETGSFSKCQCGLCLKSSIVIKATACCAELLTNLGTYAINVQEKEITELKLHLGIGAGQIYDVHVVGDSNRAEHLIAGDAVTQVSNVLDFAKPGIYDN